MRYWDEMTSKYGFNDGESIPEGIEIYRDIYIRTVNKLASGYGSKVRAYGYDRPGVHNWCMVLFREASSVTEDEELADGPMEAAIDDVKNNCYLDDFVMVDVQLDDEEFESFLENLEVGNYDQEA